ncbi:ty3-gypsy retrotransposon protein [Tanacetum coccineum]|uniref:Ty3-gypsy retrotransposon protein n=1 Tax=Tanacetum coccineum TaxID=301880 RepID=A0ABQ5FJT2_9ASTR
MTLWENGMLLRDEDLVSCLKGCPIPILSAKVVSTGAFIVTIYDIVPRTIHGTVHRVLFMVLFIGYYSRLLFIGYYSSLLFIEKKSSLMDEQAIHLLLKEQSDALHAQIAALATEWQAAKLIQPRPGGGEQGSWLPRFMRLEVPKFNRTEPKSWIFAIQEYFDLLQTTDDQRLKVIGFNLEGAAAEWFRWMSRNKLITSWEGFLESVRNRFGPCKYEDPQRSLSKLLQTGTVAQYQSEFEKLVNRVTDISENLLISFYISVSKRRAFWSLNEDILKITILKTNTPYPSRKIRRIRACIHQRPQRNKTQYAVSRRSQYAVLEIWNEYNILEDIKRGPYSKKSPIRRDLDNSTSNVLIPLDSWTSGLLVYKFPLNVITEYLVNIRKRRAFWSLNEDILKINYSKNQYAVSIKEDTATSRRSDPVETDIFPAIAFNDEVSSEKTLSCEPTVSSLNDEIDFRISFDDSDDEDYTWLERPLGCIGSSQLISFRILLHEFLNDFISDSLLLTPLCCDDIHDVTPRVSALAGCDRLVSEPLVIENYVSLIRKKFCWGTIFPIGLKRYRDPKEEPIEKEPLMELKEIGQLTAC